MYYEKYIIDFRYALVIMYKYAILKNRIKYNILCQKYFKNPKILMIYIINCKILFIVKYNLL